MFCLQGYAGTGKTTIIRDAIYWYMDGPGKWDKKIAVTAPTHKAKKVVSDATGLQGKTIQSLVGLAPNVDVLNFDINNPEFALLNKPTISQYSVILVDEASMLNTELFELLYRQAAQFNVKLLFMCDSAQLPPIGEEMSPVVISELIGVRYQLTKVERQTGDNPLMLVYDAIRTDINSTRDNFSHISHLLSTNVDRSMGVEFLTDLKTFGGRVVTAFNSVMFNEDPDYCKVLCWTNKRVSFWNNAIRATIIDKRRKSLPPEEILHDSIILPNELLLGYSTYSGGIVNSGEYRVKDIKYEEEIAKFGPYVNNDIFAGRENKVSFFVYDVLLESTTEPDNCIRCSIVEPTTDNYQKFIMPFNWYLGQGKFNKRWSMYYSWRNKYMLLTDIRDINKRLIVKKDLDYAYALSVHKAQGSTFSEVFIDEIDIDQLENENFVQFLFQQDRKIALTARNVKYFDKKYPSFKTYYHHKLIEKNKLKYVALSRPSTKATVFTTKT